MVVDDEVAALREVRAAWERTWVDELSLGALLKRLSDPILATAISPPPQPEDAGPVRIAVDLATKPRGLREPLLELQSLSFAATMIERAKADVVAECRSRGRSWAHIGDALGVARQTAWMKYAVEEDE
jgi:hypothetical protein